MKRSEALTPLSRDHHQALSVALGLKRAERVGAGAAMVEFFNAHGREHFRIEEDVLLPGWLELDPHGDRAGAARLADEHLSIRVGVRRLRRGALALEEIHALGGLLEAHVRFEERELFPLIEARLSDADLARLGAEVAAAESD